MAAALPPVLKQKLQLPLKPAPLRLWPGSSPGGLIQRMRRLSNGSDLFIQFLRLVILPVMP